MESREGTRSAIRAGLALFVLAGCGETVLAQPVLSTPLVLPGDQAASPAAGTQQTPRISRGSNGYLVVWADNRSSLVGAGPNGPYFGQGLGTMFDIYAARLDAAGNVLDTTPIILSQAMYNQTVPRVGWNGQNWLVVWMTERESDRYFYDLVAVRVAPDGTVLDFAPILVNSADTSINQYTPWAVSSDGTNWVVIWRDLDPAAGVFTIDGARIAPNGTILDPGGKRLRQDTWNSGATHADLAFAGDEYLMVWLETDPDSGGWIVHAQRLELDLDGIGSPFKVNLYSPSAPERPDVASDGSGFLVVWSEERYYGSSQLIGSRVSHTGRVLDPDGIQITGYAGYTLFDPDVTWDGSRYLVAYNMSKNFQPDDIYVTRASSAGAVSDPNGIPVGVAPGYQNEPTVAAAAGGGAQVAWNDALYDGDIAAAPVSAAGSAGVVVPVSLGAPRQSVPRFASDGTSYLIVFRSEISGESRIEAQRLDSSGNPVDAEPIRVATGTRLTNPSAAWNGSHYLIVWENPSEGRGQIYGRRMRADGSFLDAVPIPIMGGLYPDVAALGGTFLVVGADNDTDPHFRYAYAIRVASDGTVLGPRQRIGQSFDVWPRVAAFGSRWLAVWEQNITHDNPSSRIVAGFIGTDGLLQSRFNVSDGADDTPHLAVAGDTALVVWESNDILGRRIRQDGTLLDTAAGIVISGAPEEQLIPAAAWDGSLWVVDYVDLRNDPYPAQERGDVFAARVDGSGAVVDPSGFAVADSLRPEDTPTVAAAGGFWIFAYAAFQDRAPYANLRIATRTNSPSGGSTPGRCEGLLANKNPNGVDLDLLWGPSCLAGADYGIYEGTLGTWYSHEAVQCSTGGTTSATIRPAGGDRYFLVVPNDPTYEGSYGTDSAGAERPAAPGACRAVQDVGACP